MASFKLVISDKGKAFQKEVSGKEADAIVGMKLGETLQGSVIGLEGYELEIRGGSDKSGTPHLKGLHITGATKLLLSGGTGYHPLGRGIRDRKRVQGERILDDSAQVNLNVKKSGAKPLEEIFGKKEEKPS